MKHFGLFEGIGGFSLAGRWMGWETVGWCEWNEFCQKILRYHFPKAEGFGDITKTDFTKYANTIDILTGGFPCQPFSVSGEQQGDADIRFLYPEMLRAIREIKPRWVVAENVRGITSPKFATIFQEICSSLEAEGYETLPPILIPASSVGADHERYRVWIIAYSNGKRYERVEQSICQEQEQVEVATKALATYKLGFGSKDKLPKPLVISRNNGISVRLDGITFPKWMQGSIGGFGNAIVPHIAFEIFRTIQQYENASKYSVI